MHSYTGNRDPLAALPVPVPVPVVPGAVLVIPPLLPVLAAPVITRPVLAAFILTVPVLAAFLVTRFISFASSVITSPLTVLLFSRDRVIFIKPSLMRSTGCFLIAFIFFDTFNPGLQRSSQFGAISLLFINLAFRIKIIITIISQISQLNSS